MSFRDQGWSSRFGAMGDEAEQMFEAVYPRGYVRYGLNRPPISVGKLSLKIRYTPDYLTTSSLVEVQGFGRDGLVKLKLEKERALHLWSADMPTQLFLWDRSNKQYGYIDIHDMTKGAHAHGALEWLDDKRAWFIPATELEMEWASASS